MDFDNVWMMPRQSVAARADLEREEPDADGSESVRIPGSMDLWNDTLETNFRVHLGGRDLLGKALELFYNFTISEWKLVACPLLASGFYFVAIQWAWSLLGELCTSSVSRKLQTMTSPWLYGLLSTLGACDAKISPDVAVALNILGWAFALDVNCFCMTMAVTCKLTNLRIGVEEIRKAADHCWSWGKVLRISMITIGPLAVVTAFLSIAHVGAEPESKTSWLLIGGCLAWRFAFQLFAPAAALEENASLKMALKLLRGRVFTSFRFHVTFVAMIFGVQVPSTVSEYFILGSCVRTSLAVVYGLALAILYCTCNKRQLDREQKLVLEHVHESVQKLVRGS